MKNIHVPLAVSREPQPLHVREWGAGEKTAFLIHGLAASSSTWETIATHLADSGYHVYAPDLTGHGDSPRCHEYSLDAWVEDIAHFARSNNLHPQLIMGHSMGGLISSRLQPLLTPEKTILLDPVFHLPQSRFILTIVRQIFKHSMISREQEAKNPIAKITGLLHPAAPSLEGEIATWDSRTVMALAAPRSVMSPIFAGSFPTLLIRAARSYIAPRRLHRRLSSSYALQQFSTSHTIHMDDPETLSQTINSFLAPTAPVSLLA